MYRILDFLAVIIYTSSQYYEDWGWRKFKVTTPQEEARQEISIFGLVMPTLIAVDIVAIISKRVFGYSLLYSRNENVFSAKTSVVYPLLAIAVLRLYFLIQRRYTDERLESLKNNSKVDYEGIAAGLVMSVIALVYFFAMFNFGVNTVTPGIMLRLADRCCG